MKWLKLGKILGGQKLFSCQLSKIAVSFTDQARILTGEMHDQTGVRLSAVDACVMSF